MKEANLKENIHTDIKDLLKNELKDTGIKATDKQVEKLVPFVLSLMKMSNCVVISNIEGYIEKLVKHIMGADEK